MEAKHTKTPWFKTSYQEYPEHRTGYLIGAEHGRDVAKVTTMRMFNAAVNAADTVPECATAEDSANADFIVQACNSHEALMDIKRKAAAFLQKIDDITTEDFGVGADRSEREALRAALTLAEMGG